MKKLAALIESSTPDDAALLKRLAKKAAKNPAHFVQSDEGGSKPAPSVEQDERGACDRYQVLNEAGEALLAANHGEAYEVIYRMMKDARAASANGDRFDPYRLKVAEECCERLMSACTDAGCPDGVRMDDWIRENIRSTSANVAQNDKQPLTDHLIWEIADLVWRRKSITTDRAFELDFAHEVIAAALHEARATSPANVAQGAEAVGLVMTNDKGEKYGALLDSNIEERTKLYAAPPAQTANTDDPIALLIAKHAEELENNEYAYFELAYTRRTEWMAWICSNHRDDDSNRKVIARGQGSTPQEACDAALTAAQSAGDTK